MHTFSGADAEQVQVSQRENVLKKTCRLLCEVFSDHNQNQEVSLIQEVKSSFLTTN